MTRQVDENWKQLQQTTFTKWVNNALRGHLKTAKTQVNDLQTDLQDGLILVQLIEAIANPRKVGRYNKNPVIKAQKLENLGAVLRFLERESIKIVNIGALQYSISVPHSFTKAIVACIYCLYILLSLYVCV